MKSVMQHVFSQVPRAEIQRSQFDRTCGYKSTFDAGKLIPIFVDEVLPGDTFNMQATTFARMQTPIVPLMDNLFADVHWFFVPNRLVWDNWERFNGAQDDPDDTTDFTIPIMDVSSSPIIATGNIGDYLGLQLGTYAPGGAATISALPFRCLNLIWNEWYRDQNLQDSLTVNVDNGPDDFFDYPDLPRNKRHDYFTSCLPWPQKGDAVTLPLGSVAPVHGYTTGSNNYWQGRKVSDNSAAGLGDIKLQAGAGSTSALADAAGNPIYMIPEISASSNRSSLYADLTNATAATINSIREAFQIQRLLERDARGGTRYVEILLSHFGVTAPDFRLQRPEFLGGATTKVGINPVPQTSSTDATTPQGNLAAYGTFSHSGRNGFVKSFVEHGYVIGLLSVRSDINYQTGIHRMWTRRTRYDFYWPALSHLGEQAVLNKELYWTGTPATDDDVFGYQERYAEYRYKPSLITGKFRSSASGTLDFWHLAQNFTAAQDLNDNFIRDATATTLDRAVAVPAEPQFMLDCYFNLKCARPMPTYSVPGYIDHF